MPLAPSWTGGQYSIYRALLAWAVGHWLCETLGRELSGGPEWIALAFGGIGARIVPLFIAAQGAPLASSGLPIGISAIASLTYLRRPDIAASWTAKSSPDCLAPAPIGKSCMRLWIAGRNATLRKAPYSGCSSSFAFTTFPAVFRGSDSTTKIRRGTL